jgi:putative acetyltransferase
MAVSLRRLRPDETRTFLEVHHTAVRVTAATDYSSEVVEAWAPLPITEDAVQSVLASAAAEIRVAAVSREKIVGIGVVVPNRCELRACYVSPDTARSGVGKAIVGELERIARADGAPFLELDSSLTAEAFYLKLGYRVLGRGGHVLASGHRMACVKMRKEL